MDADGQPLRHAPREPAFNLAPAVVAALVTLFALHAMRVFLLSPEADIALIERFAFIPARGLDTLPALATLFTHSLLHGDATHLVVNAIWLAAFGSPLAVRFGAWRFAAFWIVTAAAGALAFLAFLPDEAGAMIGASGAISGMTGAAARYGFRVDRLRRPAGFAGAIGTIGQTLTDRNVVAFVGVWLAINLVAGTGLLTGSAGGAVAWQAHLGGFAAGFLLARFFDPPRPG